MRLQPVDSLLLTRTSLIEYGLAQIHDFRGETDTQKKIEQRVEFDPEYIENRSVWFDPYMLCTVSVLFPREAY